MDNDFKDILNDNVVEVEGRLKFEEIIKPKPKLVVIVDGEIQSVEEIKKP